jgi:hypothetical protein
MNRLAWGRPKTRRWEQDMIYRFLAAKLISDTLAINPDSELRRLYDPDKATAKPVILTELGRALGKMPIEDWGHVAHQAARSDWRAKDVAKEIRRIRRAVSRDASGS